MTGKDLCARGPLSRHLRRSSGGRVGPRPPPARRSLTGPTGPCDRRRPLRPRTQPARFTIETWIRTTTTRGGKIVGFGNRTQQNSSRHDKHIYMRNDGRLVFGVQSGGARTVATSGAYNDGQWHHVVATQGPLGQGMSLYVDGQLRASNILVSGNDSQPGYWRVGGDNLSGWPNRPTSNFFEGQIDETAIYPSALSGSTISAHYALRNG
ncbi:hypothetical protein SBADM41S_10506 [Streptomyces badius]